MVKGYKKIYPFRLKSGSSIINYPLQLFTKSTGIISKKPHLSYAEIKQTLNLCSQDNPTQQRVIYVHIPFCDSICAFCGFNRIIKEENTLSEYIQTIKKEVNYYADTDYVQALPYDALYFGGGTPSALSSDQLVDLITYIINKLPMRCGAEITIEGNPSNFNEEKLKVVSEVGVNRISFGVQTFNYERAQLLNLPQTPSLAIERISQAQALGYDNIDIDIMYNYPDQDFNDLCAEIKIALSLSLAHISWYPINIKNESLLSRMIPSGKIKEQKNGDIEICMYCMILEKMEEEKFEQKTLTSYSRPGMSNLYNLIRSKGIDDVLSFGPGIFGYLNKCIYKNVNNIQEYMNIINSGNYAWSNATRLTLEEEMRSFMIKGLRSNEISKKEFWQRFHKYPEEVFEKTIQSLIEKKLIKVNSDMIRLTKLGNIWGLNVCFEFLPEELKAQCITVQ